MMLNEFFHVHKHMMTQSQKWPNSISKWIYECTKKEFILRARVLKLYRQALRTAQRAPVHARVELRQIIRQEMENNRSCNDKRRIRFLISEGVERLKGLSETLDMQGHS